MWGAAPRAARIIALFSVAVATTFACLQSSDNAAASRVADAKRFRQVIQLDVEDDRSSGLHGDRSLSPCGVPGNANALPGGSGRA